MAEPNGEIELRGFGAVLTARGLSVVAVLVLLAGLAGMLLTNWLGWRAIETQHQHWQVQMESRAEAWRLQLERATREHQASEQKLDAMIYVLALSPEARARLKLKQPPALRALLDSS